MSLIKKLKWEYCCARKKPPMTGVRGINIGQSLKVSMPLMGPSIPLKVIFNFRSK